MHAGDAEQWGNLCGGSSPQENGLQVSKQRDQHENAWLENNLQTILRGRGRAAHSDKEPQGHVLQVCDHLLYLPHVLYQPDLLLGTSLPRLLLHALAVPTANIKQCQL